VPLPDTIRAYVEEIWRSAKGRLRNLSRELEQVHVRGMNCRALRLKWVAGLGLALALPVLPVAAAQNIATQTTLNIATSDQAGRTEATASIAVTSADGKPAAGAVIIDDGTRQLAEVALNGSGQATSVVTLTGGEHALRAVYAGDSAHLGSASPTSNVTGQVSGTPNFAVSLSAVAPSTLPLTLALGQSGTVAVTITPQDNAALTAPMFITLSCSGLPALSSCAFTPESIEILPTTPASCPSGSPASSCPPVSSMLIQTQGQYATAAPAPGHAGRHRSPIAWAILLPGVLGLGGLAWGARRRAWLSRLALVALLGLVTTLGTTACNPLYYYENHGPGQPPSTPTGTFNITVTGQSANGVTAITNSTTMVLTVQ
jgi:Bacterial Ig-like domain (group 3)